MRINTAQTLVKALFVVTSVAKDNHGGTKIQCHATQGKKWPEDKESQDFAEATPSGELNFYIANGRPAAEFFIPGDEVYLTFEKRQPKVE